MARLTKAAAARWPDIVPRGTSPKRRRKTIQRPEQIEGAKLIEWIDLVVLPDGTRPGELFAHVPNGGKRNAHEGAILKKQGVRAGYPDYVHDLPRGRYHGLRMELKAKDGDGATASQLELLARIEKQGYYCFIAWGFEEARQRLVDYWALPPFGA